MDELIGKRLIAVERLAWSKADGTADIRVGPVHMHFDGGRGAFFSGNSDWTFDVVGTRAGDESWLAPFQDDIDGGRWTMRDAADEPPFAGFRGSRLESWTSLRNEIGEQVGVDLAFDLGNISLKVHKGEVTT
ncbi:hypothetical protein ACFPJ1_36615 [Kribbella qitaiheensis]|uniref:hypothetical protein n=1 Tax=Kribbella qitaiheensis TaxID=1544730 RepID=UPI0036185FD5